MAATRHHQWRFFHPGSRFNAIKVFVPECSGNHRLTLHRVYLRLPTLSEKSQSQEVVDIWISWISERSKIVFQEISWRLAVIPLHLSCFRIFNKSIRQSSINVKPRSPCSVQNYSTFKSPPMTHVPWFLRETYHLTDCDTGPFITRGQVHRCPGRGVRTISVSPLNQG